MLRSSQDPRGLGIEVCFEQEHMRLNEQRIHVRPKAANGLCKDQVNSPYLIDFIKVRNSWQPYFQDSLLI